MPSRDQYHLPAASPLWLQTEGRPLPAYRSEFHCLRLGGLKPSPSGDSFSMGRARMRRWGIAQAPQAHARDTIPGPARVRDVAVLPHRGRANAEASREWARRTPRGAVAGTEDRRIERKLLRGCLVAAEGRPLSIVRTSGLSRRAVSASGMAPQSSAPQAQSSPLGTCRARLLEA
jgi:hypothetical protein